MKITDKTSYTSEVNYLKSQHFISFTYTAETDLAHGAVYPTNDAGAVGIVLHDTEAGQPVAVITEGHVLVDRLPVAPTAEAQAALKNINFY